MATHLRDDCPVMADGDATVDMDNLEVDDWIYDCRVCRYTEHHTDKAWEGGYLKRPSAHPIQTGIYKQPCSSVVRNSRHSGFS